MIAIDPGLSGAVAAITGAGIYVTDMPIMAKGKGGGRVKTQINASELASILHGYSNGHTVVLERISSMPGQGVASMFSMGDTFGCIRGVCAALGMRVEVITPQSWKKHYKLPSDKEVCRAKAIELFPDLPLGRKKDHNRAEALLMAKYAMDIGL